MERVTYLRVTAHNVLTTLRCEGGSLPGAPNFSSRSQNSEKPTLSQRFCGFCILRRLWLLNLIQIVIYSVYCHL